MKSKRGGPRRQTPLHCGTEVSADGANHHAAKPDQEANADDGGDDRPRVVGNRRDIILDRAENARRASNHIRIDRSVSEDGKRSGSENGRIILKLVHCEPLTY